MGLVLPTIDFESEVNDDTVHCLRRVVCPRCSGNTAAEDLLACRVWVKDWKDVEAESRLAASDKALEAKDVEDARAFIWEKRQARDTCSFAREQNSDVCALSR